MPHPVPFTTLTNNSPFHPAHVLPNSQNLHSARADSGLRTQHSALTPVVSPRPAHAPFRKRRHRRYLNETRPFPAAAE